MKKILFFGYTLDMGGAEKVLVDYINILKSKYEIDLVLLKAEGALMSDLPEGVGVIPIRKGIVSYVLFRFIPFFRRLTINKIASKKNYDIAIGFMEGRSATWVADIKQNIKRIAWVHNDVDFFDIGIGEKEIKQSYNAMDKVITVAEQSKQSFSRKYAIPAEKIEVLYNLVDEDTILKNAELPVEKNDCFTFVNVGRMRPQKRQDRLIEIARRLKDRGFKFKIQILGNGPEEERIRELVKEKDVSDVVELKGLIKNPYPYIKQADCVVVSSDFEGYSIAVKEALLLKKIIVSTDVSGVREIFENDKFGIVTEKSTDSLEKAMVDFFEKRIDVDKINDNLEKFDCGNGEIISRLIEIIEEQK